MFYIISYNNRQYTRTILHKVCINVEMIINKCFNESKLILIPIELKSQYKMSREINNKIQIIHKT